MLIIVFLLKCVFIVYAKFDLNEILITRFSCVVGKWAINSHGISVKQLRYEAS